MHFSVKIFIFAAFSYHWIPTLMIADFLFPKIRQLQEFYNKNDVSSLRSERVLSFLDYISC